MRERLARNKRREQGRNFNARDSRGKRIFERKSGSRLSRVKAITKRGGAGPRNWGTPGSEFLEINHLEIMETSMALDKYYGRVTVGQFVKQEDKIVRTEEHIYRPDERTEMTLDEWRAIQDASAKPTFNIRKAGEGEDRGKWKNIDVLRKLDFRHKTKKEPAHDHQHKRYVKPQIKLNIEFSDNISSDRDRMDRGCGDGSGGLYDGYRKQKEQYMPDVLNEQEFPVLE